MRRSRSRIVLCASPWIFAACLVADPSAVEAGARLEVTVTDAIDLGSRWAEITTVAMGPGEHAACPQGRLFFTTGPRVLSTTLDGDLDPVAGNPWRPTFQETFLPALIHDNHLVKLRDGSLLHTVEAGTWNDNVSPRPHWWNWTVEYPAKDESRPGARGIIYAFRSDDCGGTWTQLPGIDAATLVVPNPSGQPTKGLCGTPRRRVEDGVKVASLGGWDGHFLYADPFADDVYLSTPCYYGTLQVGEARSARVLLRSRDRGASWEAQDVTHDYGTGMFRAPVVSRPGRVAFGDYEPITGGLAARINLFDPSSTNPEFSSDVKALRDAERKKTTPTLLNTHRWSTLSLARYAQGFLYSVPSYRHGALIHEVFGVSLKPVRSTRVDTIWTHPPHPQFAWGDTAHATLVPGLPNDPQDLTAYYWLDARGSGASTTYGVRFQVYSGTRAVLATPGWLTLAEGKPYRYGYDAEAFVGEYMSGSVYRAADGSRRFVTAWSEAGRLRFNTIEVKHTFVPGGASPGPVKVGMRPPRPVRPKPLELGPDEGMARVTRHEP